MTDLHELARIVGLVLIGVTACVCLYKLGAWAIRKLDSPCPPDPVRAVQPVPDTTEQPQDGLHIVGRNALGKASGL